MKNYNYILKMLQLFYSNITLIILIKCMKKLYHFLVKYTISTHVIPFYQMFSFGHNN